ncbi:histidine acid phosphatase family protein [Heterostelium album PN500]|uniref:Histidine acid phosphatase family protein n=1 Tax=Heterostelium pallidum (strain ATCC 26659 / Pp 5 / PN500) TaxID=670386 RepID=D3BHH3_HETP5|nr:histidine acid phosphatase family protein [Heterostelium album PN500]EFA79150.1 histidine acid phosphatase family protein [Heterostelium album PN500]|eukprot:XP_020431272.1 histidine acid phosphatase family protein [Heterostelium album PN500]
MSSSNDTQKVNNNSTPAAATPSTTGSSGSGGVHSNIADKIHEYKCKSETSPMNTVKDLVMPVDEYRPAGYHLKMMQVITRHGRRTPESNRYPLSLWSCNSVDNLIVNKDANRPECNLGQLTVFGTRDLINLGKNYHRMLIDKVHFLSDEYKPDEIFVRSSDRERTISSARSLMHGLYGGAFADAQEHMLNAATSFVILPEAVENIYPRGSCPRYAFLKSILPKHPKVLEEQKNSKLEDFSQRLRDIFEASKGYDSPFYVPSWRSYAGLVNSFDCFKNHGLPLPEGFNDEIVERMYLEASKEYKRMSLFPEMQRLGIGRFIGDLNKQLKSKATNQENTKDLKFGLYSAHDSTLGALLVAYDMYEENTHPETASALEFLLFEKDQNNNKKVEDSKQQQLATENAGKPTTNQQQQQFVKVIYNQKPVHIKKCKEFEVDEMCPYEKFIEISQELIPKDWNQECKISEAEKKSIIEEMKASPKY